MLRNSQPGNSANLDMLVVQNPDSAAQMAQYLRQDGLIIADIPLHLSDKQQWVMDSVYFYANAVEDFSGGKRSWPEFSGNLFIRKSLSRQLVRLWNIFARVPLRHWPGTMKTLWRILH